MSGHVSAQYDNTAARQQARRHYEYLRSELVRLCAASLPDAAAIDATVWALERAQLAYKATHGLVGNNPTDDP